MRRIPSEFDEGERLPRDVLQGSLDDAQAQLRRAQARLARAEQRVRNLELAVQGWKVLMEQYDESLGADADRTRTHVQL